MDSKGFKFTDGIEEMGLVCPEFTAGIALRFEFPEPLTVHQGEKIVLSNEGDKITAKVTKAN